MVYQPTEDLWLVRGANRPKLSFRVNERFTAEYDGDQLTYIIGGKGQNPENASQPIIGVLGGKKRPVPAIMLNGKQPHQHGSGRQGQQQRKPITRTDCPGHEGIKGNEGNQSYEQFPDGAAIVEGFKAMMK